MTQFLINPFFFSIKGYIVLFVKIFIKNEYISYEQLTTIGKETKGVKKGEKEIKVEGSTLH